MEPTYLGPAENLESALAYVLGFVTGIFLFFMEEWNRTVRFHALQSTLFSLVWIAVIFGADLIPPAAPVILPLQVAGIVVWLSLIVLTYTGRKISLPVIGAMAEARA